MKICKVGIIGAGLSGLSLAYKLKKIDSKINVTVIEADKKAGGLLKSENVEGWTFDTGGSHIIFSKNEETLKEIIGVIGDVVEHRRKTCIYYNGSFIKYPFENGIYMLSAEERYSILQDFVQNLLRKERGELKTPENLLEWFYYVFGNKITEKYLKPYNEKLWKRDLREISLQWVGNRVPNPPIDDILKACVGIETEGYTHQARFYYPLTGGIETLIRKLVEFLKKENFKLITDEKVKKIKIEDGRKIVTCKSDYEFDVLVSTAPLDKTAKFTKSIKKERKYECETYELDYNSLTVVGLGCKGKTPNFHWLYIPDEDVIFHRVAFLHNYSPNMCPKSKDVNIIAEISHKPGEKVKNAVDKTIEGLEKIGIGEKLEFEVSKVWEWEYAYVVYNHKYSNAVKLRNYLSEVGIYPFGRFGGWEYLNMDAVWIKASKLAENIYKTEK